jgi:prepilin-type N-terminal cleavage/methylation domain-containing protein
MRGFTLIEVVLVITIMGLIVVIGVPLIYEASQSQTVITQMANASTQVDSALQSMVKQIRIIRANNHTGITFAGSTLLMITTTTGEQIRYRLSSGNLLMQTASGSGVLADNVETLHFTYYDSAGQITATVANIHYVKITLKVAHLPAVTAVVYCRNAVV